MSVNNTNPATLFGGTWEQLKDRFLLGAGDTYTNGATGGEAEHTLTIAEIPAHSHNLGQFVSTNSGSVNGLLEEINKNAYGALNTNETGGGKAHNNMPPYLVVYMWRRTK